MTGKLKALNNSLSWRWHFVVEKRQFSLADRLVYVWPFAKVTAAQLIERTSRVTADGEEYFQLNGLKVFYASNGRETSVGREEALTVIKETFWTEDLFSDDIQLRSGQCVLDLGGNIGTCALEFARRLGSGGRIYTFEPITHSVLERNVDANAAANVEVVPKAVSDSVGATEMHVGSTMLDSSIARAPAGASRTLTVETTTVDAFVEERRLDRVDFIKMDIEGAEEKALRGAARTIERFHPDFSIASYHTDDVGDKQHPKLVRFLKSAGYTVAEKFEAGRPVRIFARYEAPAVSHSVTTSITAT